MFFLRVASQVPNKGKRVIFQKKQNIEFHGHDDCIEMGCFFFFFFFETQKWAGFRLVVLMDLRRSKIRALWVVVTWSKITARFFFSFLFGSSYFMVTWHCDMKGPLIFYYVMK
jgi:hypothetical protein